MSVDNVLLLRVGIDSGTGNGHGPLFQDNSFEYIPIPEGKNGPQTSEDRTYADISDSASGTLADHVPHLADQIPHFDPEFESYTYGDPSPNKRSQLSRLASGDLLIYYSSLRPQDVDVGARLHAIGYFTVDEVFDLEEIDQSERAVVLDKVANNAHAKRTGLTPSMSVRDNFPVIVTGRPTESRLFETPRPLGGSDRKVLPWVADIIGFDGDLTRAGVARVLDESNAESIQDWLDKGSDLLVEEDQVLRSYVMTTDSGFAPNVTGGICTLATCKPRVRSHATVGDWIMGTPSRSDGEEQIIHLTRVDETLTYDEYYHDERFQMKQPENDPNGDNIYYLSDGVLTQDERTNHHNNPEDRQRDLNTDRVLVGETFWYFGGASVTVPEHLRHDVIHKYKQEGRRFYSNAKTEPLRKLVEWCSLRFDPGNIGRDVEGSSGENTAGSGC